MHQSVLEWRYCLAPLPLFSGRHFAAHLSMPQAVSLPISTFAYCRYIADTDTDTDTKVKLPTFSLVPYEPCGTHANMKAFFGERRDQTAERDSGPADAICGRDADSSRVQQPPGDHLHPVHRARLAKPGPGRPLWRRRKQRLAATPRRRRLHAEYHRRWRRRHARR